MSATPTAMGAIPGLFLGGHFTLCSIADNSRQWLVDPGSGAALVLLSVWQGQHSTSQGLCAMLCADGLPNLATSLVLFLQVLSCQHVAQPAMHVRFFLSSGSLVLGRHAPPEVLPVRCTVDWTKFTFWLSCQALLCRVTLVHISVSVCHDLAPLTAVPVACDESSAFFLGCDLKWTRFPLRSVRMKPLLVYMRCCGLSSFVHRVFSWCTSQFPLNARTRIFRRLHRCVLVEAYTSSSRRCDSWTTFSQRVSCRRARCDADPLVKLVQISVR